MLRDDQVCTSKFENDGINVRAKHFIIRDVKIVTRLHNNNSKVIFEFHCKKQTGTHTEYLYGKLLRKCM
jgi:hypothetical protein